MGFAEIFVIVLIFIVAILLGIIVLVQNPKGGGLASNFGAANQIGGVRRTADFLEKATWTLAIAMVLLCLLSSYLRSDVGVLDESDLENPGVEQTTDGLGDGTEEPVE